jgi:hypothetical protein
VLVATSAHDVSSFVRRGAAGASIRHRVPPLGRTKISHATGHAGALRWFLGGQTVRLRSKADIPPRSIRPSADLRRLTGLLSGLSLSPPPLGRTKAGELIEDEANFQPGNAVPDRRDALFPVCYVPYLSLEIGKIRMANISPLWWVVALSELVAIVLIVRIWRSHDILFLKLALTIIALIPVAGPVLALWIGAFPNRASETVQNRGSRGQYYRIWSPVLGAQSPIQRFRRWRSQVVANDEADP